ncbi:MAG: helix-turn-helix domain-containing protein [Arenicellales bacterium]|nr:helix-turn-helix domain-containing protein [Arenicellales bacterium]
MTCQSITLRDADEIERFFFKATGMKPGYFQLSKGQVDLQIRSVELAGVTLMWSRTPGRVRWCDQMTGESLHIGFAVESFGPITTRGRAVDANDAQVWIPGKEMDLIMAGPYLSLDIGVEPQLVEELGWQIDGEPIKKVPGDRLARFIRTCECASRIVSRVRRGALNAQLGTKPWRDLILDQLEPILQPWLAESQKENPQLFCGTRYYRLLKQADEFFDGLACGEPFEVDQLVKSTGVSRRAIFDAYRKLLGIGPRRYFELKRLYQLRHHLKEASKPDVTVAKLAVELGFGDLGRLAALYRIQFGENPSETLQRT